MTYETPSGANMFAYCMNNPVSMADNGGEAAHIVIGALMGAAINVATSMFYMYHAGENYTWGDFAIDAAGGAISGGLAASGVGVLYQTAINGVIGGATEIARSINMRKTPDVNKVIRSFACGAISGMIGGDGLTANQSIKQSINILNKHTSTLLTQTSDLYALHFGKIAGEAAEAQLRFVSGMNIAQIMSSAADSLITNLKGGKK